MPALVFMFLSACIILMMGAVHLFYTFFGDRLTPRSAALRASMEANAPVISSETTMWQAWVGFNASHSIGAILFGCVFGYLAARQTELLFRSPFLLTLGLAVLTGYWILGRIYWFKVPFAGISVSLLCYLIAIGCFWSRA